MEGIYQGREQRTEQKLELVFLRHLLLGSMAACVATESLLCGLFKLRCIVHMKPIYQISKTA